ncbi:MAG: sigma-54-dependent Fis family transcriptional regulator [Desulfobacteraceae bacterium]|nr:sigma-54-dependent Fis family transcriptional regulator [Desulfobacteraceae bacterium]MBC2754917.1 sigma-54-dependent Fis family transcriptional regulator [Desulfobacteraceae bacterium]
MAYILVVDDEEKMQHLLSIMLVRQGYSVDRAGDGIKALEMIRKNPYDLVISDIRMPRMDGIALLSEIKALDIACPVVFITAFATIDSAVDAMRQGVADYITKPFDEERILLTVERTLGISRIIAENIELKQQLLDVSGGKEIVYVSEKMTQVVENAARVAASDTAVLITGESGTGKEVIASFIHFSSSRSKARFVPVNCAAISPSLVESELFGYEKGAFTGADRRTKGKFEYANGGTLFLDEIGDLSLEAQAKLLRALQDKKVQRVGGNQEIPLDVRILCATNQDLSKLVKKGTFRQDLFYRINVFPIQTPALRERIDDIVPLADYFLKQLTGGKPVRLTEGAVRTLQSYNWPGNVRELANAMERVMIIDNGEGSVTADTLSFLRASSAGAGLLDDLTLPPEGISLETLQYNFVKQAMEQTGNNQSAAASLLGLTRAKFRVLVKQAMENDF